ncbi:hypothetical protein BpHYR1_026630 [Brachionus plicatilis]|uniref:Uncharacterized protein n=1 Tax=Brachionus plicatilis TaxID=10195 RepID=A0A3M7PBG7_BRAPC|nr:hypothetical protein BpHYR1_026630 [Brachionus plicatilis]
MRHFFQKATSKSFSQIFDAFSMSIFSNLFITKFFSKHYTNFNTQNCPSLPLVIDFKAPILGRFRNFLKKMRTSKRKRCLSVEKTTDLNHGCSDDYQSYGFKSSLDSSVSKKSKKDAHKLSDISNLEFDRTGLLYICAVSLGEHVFIISFYLNKMIDDGLLQAWSDLSIKKV